MGWRYALAFCLLACGSFAKLHAEEIPQINVMGEDILAEGAELRWGSMEFHPYLAFNYEWIDNLFYDKKNPEDDTLYTMVPGVNINWPFAGNHTAKLNWQSQVRRYNDNPDVNNHQQLGDAFLKLDYDRYWFEFRNKYAYLQEVGDIEITDRQVRWANDASFQTGVRFERFDMIMGYAKRLRVWPKEEDHDLSYSEDQGHMTFDIKVKPTLDAFTRFEFKSIDYDDDLKFPDIRRNDQKRSTAIAGFKGSWGSSVGWSMAAGFEHIRLHKRTRSARDLWGETASDHPILRGSIKWDVVPERTLLEGSANRGVGLSTGSDYADTLNLNLAVRHRWSQRLTTRAEVGFTDYNRAKGADYRLFNAQVSTQYRITRWANAYLRYEYVERNALDDPSGGDFRRNSVQLGVILAW
ncbi:MAG: hypothetical protein AMXMBFR7_35660 [Planctomycetota bacterium]